MRSLALRPINWVLRHDWGKSRGGKGHWKATPEPGIEVWHWDRPGRETARWRRRLGVWQWKLAAKQKARDW